DAADVGTHRGVDPVALPRDDGQEPERHAPLRDDRAPGGAGDAESDPEDEHDAEDGIADETEHGGDERGPRVLQAAEDAGRREHEEHGGDAEGADPQVGDGLVEGLRRGPEDPGELGSGDAHDRAGEDTEACGEPDASGADSDRSPYRP